MAEREPLVSVVTPVRNGAEFLGECIESVRSQAYSNWEYVVLNNCSTDDSLAIAERHAAGDKRIRVLSTPVFLDSIDSHNFALGQISRESKYCKVVHADDWIFPECISRMVALAEAYPSVGIVSAYRLEGGLVGLDGLPYPSIFVSGREIARRSLLGGPDVFGSPTSLLVRSGIVHSRGEFYTEREPWTDSDVCYDILRTWDFGFVHQVLTFTRRHDRAASTFSGRLSTYALAELVLLKKYGRDFLSESELSDRTWELLREYRRFLVRSALDRRGRDFWQYHIRGLELVGHPLKFHQLVLTAASMASSHVLYPFLAVFRSLRDSVSEQVLRRFPAAHLP